MKLFITGASGYLGSQMVKQLCNDYQVFALIRNTSSIERLQSVLDSITLVKIDLEGHLAQAFARYTPDIVINTAALYGRKGELPEALVQANITFPLQLLQFAQQCGCKAFINTGTALPDNISPYAMTKNTFVKLAAFYPSNCKFINLSLEHFFGPGDDTSKFTTFVINQCSSGGQLELTEGTQKRDFIYIDDVINAYRTVIENIQLLDNQESISVGSGVAPTVREFVELTKHISESDVTLSFGAVPTRDNELMYSCADTTRLLSLGWQIQYSLAQGITKTLAASSS